MFDQPYSTIKNPYLTFEGDAHAVLNAAANNLPGVRKIYPGGGMSGVCATGCAAAGERLHKSSPRVRRSDCYANSVGGSTALGEAYGNMRLFAHKYYRNFCTEDFISSWTTIPCLLGQKISTEFYAKEMRELVEENQSPHPLNRLCIGLTRYEDAQPIAIPVRFSDKKQTIDLVRATASIPGISEGLHMINGVAYCDGMIADPLPVRSAIRRGPRPRFLLVVMTCPESAYIGEPTWSEYMLYNLKRRKIPTVLREALLSRHERFLEQLAWVRDQEKLSLSDPDRELPPTCIVWPKEHVGMFEIDPKVIKQALARSFRGWQQVYSQTKEYAT